MLRHSIQFSTCVVYTIARCAHRYDYGYVYLLSILPQSTRAFSKMCIIKYIIHYRRVSAAYGEQYASNLGVQIQTFFLFRRLYMGIWSICLCNIFTTYTMTVCSVCVCVCLCVCMCLKNLHLLQSMCVAVCDRMPAYSYAN